MLPIAVHENMKLADNTLNNERLSLHCSDVIATLIITNCHLYLMQLWCQFFQIFVYGDVVYAQTWEVLTMKNCIESP